MGNNVKALLKAVDTGNWSKVKEFFDKGIDVNSSDDSGCTPLMWASLCGYPEIVENLLTEGANVNVKDHEGGTALMEAAVKGHKLIVKLLLAFRADVNARDNNGKTALGLAKDRKLTEIVDLLKNAGGKE